ncbi:hypothetical protein [Alkalicoccus halolimnae]|uniref:DUF1440 domain-containing protein n=1 Tax=Alkalicoccus halolimnae TaxID=1667239 RepID=A0AAJ8LXQ5_9BACI|nr:hypothetical protein [Alkalicoccus halolimnae]
MKRPGGKALSYVVFGGIISGVLFGIMMQMQGMIGMAAAMVGSESTVVGWFVHMVISVIFGISFVMLTFFIRNMWTAAVVLGIGIWIAGPLVIMPLMLGMGTMIGQALAPDQLMSLVTHLFFAFITAVVVNVLQRIRKLFFEAAPVPL